MLTEQRISEESMKVSFKAMPAICHSDATSKLPRSHKNEVLASSNG
ncbi:unnamed protein product [Callosobruchus maculatus]|uniref:Uncharacterized protein n=1 Tax=Callosobruchus maculatus TaxID=64391 RepID=A0A653BY98_CALMS|nr:unnamed protein product [Callosobruchus maculatus]